MTRGAPAGTRPARSRCWAPPIAERVDDLVARQADIHRLAAQNPSFTGDLLRTELTKTERLVDAFIDMAVTSARYDAYLQSVDVGGLDDDRARLERDIKLGQGRRPAGRPGEEEPGDHPEAPGEDEGDPALPRASPAASST